MNNHLIDFFDDELRHNDYYKNIRQFASDRKIDMTDIVSSVVNDYEDHMDDFGPYRFVDAIEDCLSSHKFAEGSTLDDVLVFMWNNDLFENY